MNKKTIFFLIIIFIVVFVYFRMSKTKDYSLTGTDFNEQAWTKAIDKSILLNEYFKARGKDKKSKKPYLELKIRKYKTYSRHKTSININISVMELLGKSGTSQNEIYNKKFSYCSHRKQFPALMNRHLKAISMLLWESQIINNPNSITDLCKLLNKLPPDDTLILLTLITKMSPKTIAKARDLIEKQYTVAKNKNLKREAMRALLKAAKSGERGNLDNIIFDECFSPDPELRELATQNIRFCDKNTIQKLLKKIKEPGLSIDNKVYVLNALRKLKDKAGEIIPLLPFFCKSISLKMQVSALKAYGDFEHKSPDAIKILSDFVMDKNKNPNIRSAAWESLLILNSPWNISASYRHKTKTVTFRTGTGMTRVWKRGRSIDKGKAKFQVTFKPENIWFKNGKKAGAWKVKNMKLWIDPGKLNSNFSSIKKFKAATTNRYGNMAHWSASITHK